jgi:anti-sigma B factor antagonist
MAISVERLGKKVTIGVEGQLAGADQVELKRVVGEHLAQNATEFVVDFADAGYIDSRGLGGLVAASKRVRERGGRIRLENLNGELRQLFRLTRLDEIFDLGPDSGPHVA